MGQELVPTSGYSQTPVPWGFGKQLKQVNGQGVLALRGEQLHAELVEQRVDNACYLGAKAVIGLTNLNSLATQLSAGKPGLELELRAIEEGVAIGIRNALVNYINRR